jgi:hypothetical protein
MRSLLLLASLLCAGCLAPAAYMPPTDNGGRYADSIKDPKVDRCAAQPEKRQRKDCAKARDDAFEFVRRLSPGDQICLDGNSMSDGVTGHCKARALVTDSGVNKVKVEVREISPGTGFKHMQEIWYTEAALADVYLMSLGFELK